MLTVKKSILVWRWNDMYFDLCPLPLVLPLSTTEKSLALSSLLPHEVFIYVDKIPKPSLPQAEQTQLTQPFLMWQMPQRLNRLRGPLLDAFQ